MWSRKYIIDVEGYHNGATHQQINDLHKMLHRNACELLLLLLNDFEWGWLLKVSEWVLVEYSLLRTYGLINLTGMINSTRENYLKNDCVLDFVIKEGKGLHNRIVDSRSSSWKRT